MTKAQIDLLQRLIDADRHFRTRVHAGETVSSDDRGVEVGWINGVSTKTAQSLVDAGLAETLAIRGNQSYIFLGSVSPYGEIKR